MVSVNPFRLLQAYNNTFAANSLLLQLNKVKAAIKVAKIETNEAYMFITSVGLEEKFKEFLLNKADQN